MRIAIHRYYDAASPVREYLEDSVHAAAHCIRRLGWSFAHRPESTDLALAFGVHLPECVRPASGEIVVNTERVTPFGHGDLEVYLLKLRAARAVWCFYPEDAAYLQQRGVHALTWQYGPDVFPCVLEPQARRDFDLFHLGSISEHRKARLVALEQSGLRVAGAQRLPWLDKCHVLGCARAVLAFAYDETSSYLPWPRVVFARAQGLRCISDVAPTGAFGEAWCSCMPDGETDWPAFAAAHLDDPAGDFDDRSPTQFAALIDTTLRDTESSASRRKADEQERAGA